MSVEQTAEEEAQIAADLVRRIGAGDRSAEGELVARYQDRLRYVLLRQMPNRDDLEDVLQATLLATIERLRKGGIDEPERLGGFIYGVLNNIKHAQHRDAVKHRADADPELVERLEDGTPSPEQQSAQAETTRIVRQLIAELSERRDREVLLRLYVWQQDKTQVCAELDIDRDHLRKVVHRAKRRLKQLLEEAEQRRSLHLVQDAEQ